MLDLSTLWWRKTWHNLTFILPVFRGFQLLWIWIFDVNFGHVVVLEVVQVRDDQDSSPTFSRIQRGSNELSWKYFCPINFCSNCITRPSNRDPNLRSWSNFLSDNSSCMFRKWQNHFHSLSQSFCKKADWTRWAEVPFFDPENCVFCNFVGFCSVWDSLVVIPQQVLTIMNKRKRIICVNYSYFLWYDDTNVCMNLIVSCTVLFHDGSLEIQSNCHDCALMMQ